MCPRIPPLGFRHTLLRRGDRDNTNVALDDLLGESLHCLLVLLERGVGEVTSKALERTVGIGGNVVEAGGCLLAFRELTDDDETGLARQTHGPILGVLL